jgi:hypothetical protein
MLGAALLILFIVGLPISFGIGSLIGYIGWIIRKKQGKKNVIVGGISYIVAQPISFLLVAFLPIHYFDTLFGTPIPIEGFSFLDMIFAILFAVIFTITITSLLRSSFGNEG